MVEFMSKISTRRNISGKKNNFGMELPKQTANLLQPRGVFGLVSGSIDWDMSEQKPEWSGT